MATLIDVTLNLEEKALCCPAGSPGGCTPAMDNCSPGSGKCWPDIGGCEPARS